MPFRNARFSLAQLALAVSLAAILLSATLLLWRSTGIPEFWVSAVAFAPDGKTLAASLYVYHKIQAWQPTPRILGADASQSFLLFDLPNLHAKQFLERTNRSGTISVAWPVRKLGLGQSLAFSPDGTMLATKGMKNMLSIWSVHSAQKLRELSANDELTGGVSWADDGTLAASGMNACYVLRTNDTGFQKLMPQQNCVSAVLSRDGSKLVTADDDAKIELWDTYSAKRLYQLDAGGDPFHRIGLAMSPDGKLVAGGIFITENNSCFGAVRVWDSATGKVRLTWNAHSPVLAVAFSPDAATLAVFGGDEKLHLFDLHGGGRKAIDMDATIAAVAFSPDGKLLATGDSKGQLSLWSMETKELLTRVHLYHDRISSDWLILIAAGSIWLVAWLYIRRKRKRIQPRTRRRRESNLDTTS
jgi:WD40 repeat protein